MLQNWRKEFGNKAVVDGEMVGGAVVVINEITQHNHLDLLFVKNGVQSKGIGKKIWFELEQMYPNTKVCVYDLPNCPISDSFHCPKSDHLSVHESADVPGACAPEIVISLLTD